MSDLREKLAELSFNFCERCCGGITGEFVYSSVDESVKEGHRKQADKILELIEESHNATLREIFNKRNVESYCDQIDRSKRKIDAIEAQKKHPTCESCKYHNKDACPNMMAILKYCSNHSDLKDE